MIFDDLIARLNAAYAEREKAAYEAADTVAGILEDRGDAEPLIDPMQKLEALGPAAPLLIRRWLKDRS